MAWVEIGALQSCCSQLALSARWAGARWVLDRAASAERGTGTMVTGALVGVDGMQASGPHRGAPDRS